MPFYEYECENCKFYTELLQQVTDAPLKKCPSCGKNKMKKLVSAPVFRLKGGGWYETDFKSDQEKKRNLAVDKEPVESASDDSKSKPAATDAKAADSKPESKSSDSNSADSKPAASKPSVAKPSPVKAASSRAGGGLKSSAARRPAAAKSSSSAKSKSRSATRGRR